MDDGGRSRSILIGESLATFRGRYVNIQVLLEDNLVILVTDHVISPWLTYYIGKIQGASIAWVTTENYTTGINPSIAIFKREGTIYLIEAHNTHTPKLRCCHYCVLRFDPSDNNLKGIQEGRALCDGRNPKICANNEGYVVAVHERNGISVGKVNFQVDSLPIDWLHEHFLPEGHSPNVSICGNTILLVLKQAFLICRIGQLNEDKTVNWGPQIDILSATGIYPSVSLNRLDRVLLCYQVSSFKREIIISSGSIHENDIRWDSTYGRTGQIKGERPSITFEGDGSNFFVACKVSLGTKILLQPGFLPQITEADQEEEQEPNPQED